MISNKKLKVILIDDHESVRRAYADAIQAEDMFTVIAEAENAKEGLEKIVKLRPDIAVIDIHLPDADGIKLSKVVKEQSPETELIFITGFTIDEVFFTEAMEMEISGFVTKDKMEELINALNSTAVGDVYLSPKVHKHLTERWRKRKEFSEKNPDLKTLTKREYEVLKLIAENKTSKEIADELCIDERTVGTHRLNIIEKVNLKGKGKNALLVYAIKNRFLI